MIVPPCINKFYIMDLQPDNSLIRYMVEQGNTVFLVSWRNPQAEHGHLTWDDYLEHGPIAALQVVREICKVEADQYARLLRRRDDPDLGAGRAQGAW